MKQTTEKKYSYECQLCGHRWESGLYKPTACPRCKRYDWDKRKKRNG